MLPLPDSSLSVFARPITVRGLAAKSAVATLAMTRTGRAGNSAFLDYFRCPDALGTFETSGEMSTDEGYFSFGDAVCYGRLSGRRPAASITDGIHGVGAGYHGGLRLPFDLSEVAKNLREERYAQRSPGLFEGITTTDAVRRAYYFFRPILPVGVRKHLQRVRLSGWEKIPFPRWPVDFTVETLMRNTMAHLLKSSGLDRMPFIWFWPDGARSCAVMTHDVEGPVGRRFCGTLMDVDESFGITSAFQIVPEGQGDTSHRLAEQLRRRGFEVNVHDLKHDGYLFHDKREFQVRAAQINGYVKEFQCRGFRSGAMYREQSWYDAFEFSYDMSVPNVAHLEPQRGGCCTVMPYFVGNVLELPLTTLQDYSLFHMLGDYSIALWRRQIAEIADRNGLIMLLTHPDYVAETRAQAVYRDLLEHLREIRDERQLWCALPADVDRWWRNRSLMALVPDRNSWRIEGPDRERARVAYAALDGDDVVYTFDEPAAE